MRGRILNSSGGRIVTRERSVIPVLALACEGETEALYAKYLGRDYNIRIQSKVFTGFHGKPLVDEAIKYACSLEKKFPMAEVVPAVIYDLENASRQNIEAVIEAATYARRNNVRAYISVPSIERWFLLHFKHFSSSRSAASAVKELNLHLEASGLPAYKKPGSARFYTELLLRVDNALQRCTGSHLPELQNTDAECVCDLATSIQNY